MLGMGLMLSRFEARAAVASFLVGALMAALIVATHHVWGLPNWAIWSSLLELRNNFSSGNMISLAVASGICVFLGIRTHATPGERWLGLTAAVGMGLTGALHGASRNSQLLLVLLLVSVLFRFRSVRALLVGLIAVTALVALMWHFSPNIEDRFAEIASNVEAAHGQSIYTTSVGVRYRMYEEAVKGMVEHPVFGSGVGSWLPHWSKVWFGLNQRLPPDYQPRFAEINNPHNDFLLAGMETGVVGMLVLIWLLLRFITTGWRKYSTVGGITVVIGVAIFTTAHYQCALS